MKKFDLDIYSFAKNFYSDAVEWKEIFDILLWTITTEKWIKNQHSIPFSKVKLVSLWLLALENILKCLYIHCYCEAFDTSTIEKTLNDLCSKKLWHNLINLYESLPKDWQTLSDINFNTLERYSEKWISIRYSVDAFYKKGIDTKLHSWDTYISDKKRESLIKNLKLSREDSDFKARIQKEVITENFWKVKELNNMLSNLDSLFLELKEIYYKISWSDELYGSIISSDDVEDENIEIIENFIYWNPNIVLPEESHNIINSAFNK